LDEILAVIRNSNELIKDLKPEYFTEAVKDYDSSEDVHIYLGVDQLCIMQDAPADKASQIE